MYVLSVIPLSRTAPTEPLSYRSSSKLANGTLISVPLRRSYVPGVVVDCISVRDAKAELKTASFSMLRSAGEKIGSLPTAYVAAAEATARYQASSFGAVLSALFVPVLADTPGTLRKLSGVEFSEERIEAPTLERIDSYRALIDDAQGKGAVLLVVPTEAEVRNFGDLFKSFSPIKLSGAVPEKKRGALLAGAYASRGLVITTPSFSWIPIERLSAIVLERVSAGGYSMPKRPYVDVRFALTELARARAVPITYGDYPLPLEYRKKPGAPLKAVPESLPEAFDARTVKEKDGVWKAIPDDLLTQIQYAQDEGGTTAILTIRRGYAPVVVCHDCGTSVTDERGRTLSVATENGERVLRSADGTTVQSALAFCANCGSWDLVPLGIGSERVEEELRATFPKAHIIRADHDTTAAKLRTAVKTAVTTPGAIIVGTELVLPLLSVSSPVTLGIIASADSLLALPFWRARERFVRVGLMLAERSERTIVATRHPEDAALEALTNPAKSTFWQEEAAMRKILHYPPYGTLVIFQSEGSRMRVTEAQELLTEWCAPYPITHLPLRSIKGSLMRGTSILQVTADAWPDDALASRLALLPPYIKVHINAETLW